MNLDATWGGICKATAFYGSIAIVPLLALGAAVGAWIAGIAGGLFVIIMFSTFGVMKVWRPASLSIDDQGLVSRGALGTRVMRWDDVERIERRGPLREQVWLWPHPTADGRRLEQLVVVPYLYGKSAEDLYQFMVGRLRSP